MNSPITSPCSAVLTSSATITLTGAQPAAGGVQFGGLPAGLQRAGDLVVVGDRDRAEALLARGRQQHLDRRGAVAGVVGVHVQVDVDQRSLRQPPLQRPDRRSGCAGAPPGRGRSASSSSAARHRIRSVVEQLVVAGEVALHQLGGRRQARGARVEAAEEGLDKRRATSVESSRSVGAWKVPTLSEREWRSAALEVLGANGSCTWTKSSGDAAQQLLDRARDVDRQRGRPPPGRWGPADRACSAGRAPRRRRSRAARRRRYPSAVPPRRRPSLAASGFCSRAAPAREARTRSCERDGASTRTRWPRARELARDALDVGVDLVLLRLPRVRRHMGDREPFRRGHLARHDHTFCVTFRGLLAAELCASRLLRIRARARRAGRLRRTWR